MGCVQSYFKRAHNAGISPSSTQESNSKQPVSEDGTRPVQEERSITEEPESNDTSYGVEATAVRTLAATTGTVAILGTTAKTGDKKGDEEDDGRSANSATPAVVETIPEEQEEVTVNVEKAVVHEEEKIEESKKEENVVETQTNSVEKSKEDSSLKSESRPNSKLVEDNRETVEADEKEDRGIPPVASIETKEHMPSNTPPSETNKSPVSDSTNSERVSPIAKLPGAVNEETTSKKDVDNSLEPLENESVKDKEEDVSKSISSERLKTNSISNTTLSSDSIVELDNNSVKHSPSTDKVIESFDSSSTVEFVDNAIKENLKQEGTKSNPARSISSDLSNKANLPLDGEKTPDVLSPEDQERNVIEEDLPPPPPPLEEEDTPVIGDNANNQETITEDFSNSNSNNGQATIKSENTVDLTDSLQAEPQKLQSDETSHNNPEGKSSPNHQSEIVESVSPLSSNNSSINNGETAPSPVTAVSLTPAITNLQSMEESKSESITDSSSLILDIHKDTDVIRDDRVTTETNGTIQKPIENNKKESKTSETESVSKDDIKPNNKLTNGLSSRSETPNDHKAGTNKNDVLNNSQDEIKASLEKIVNGLPESKLGLNASEVANESLKDLADEKVVAAATTIQASFRGFQTRQNLKTSGMDEEESNKLEMLSKDIEVNKTNVKNEISSKVTGGESITDCSESILENADDKIINAATTIQANFRGYQTRQMLKSKADSGLEPSEENNQSVERRTPTALTPELIESVKEEVNEICNEAEVIAAERSESVDSMLRGVDHVVVGTKESALPSVSDSILAVRGSTTPPSVSEAVEEVFDSLTDVDERTINAAMTIQATFRGYQTRKALQDDTEQPDSMPDYPPPDEYLQSLEDLPPPDFEALESSYSEDVPTEPLVPPPPPDSEIFNEEDEDELAALQRPQECDELPENRLTLDTESEQSDSSLSSAATKIQAGVRGYLTRKQMQTPGGTATGTTSTSTNRTAPDSDGSLSVDGMRSVISTEEESEVTRHRATPDSEEVSEVRPSRSAMKRMSLAELPSRSHAPIRSRALSMQVAGAGPGVSDEEVWDTLKNELSDAATKIQSNFRGYRARKQLQREDAVQGTSSSSQATPTPTSDSVESAATTTTTQPASASVEAATTTAQPASASVEAAATTTQPASASVEAATTTPPASASVEAATTTTQPASASVEATTTPPALGSVEATTTQPASDSVEAAATTTTTQPASASVEAATTRTPPASASVEATTTTPPASGSVEATTTQPASDSVEATTTTTQPASRSVETAITTTQRASGEFHDIIPLTPPNVGDAVEGK
ncbi:uncharacterized protein LOC128985834 [Macrosteles quadrilineatus]|uniref:uncharacterized protein LOC128985834 n=1 Tax=Macrosteles quadrilineatus TaxID=74068 RepID=UPI0023E0B659|nr:uncharacterized protein LOC128985834 [Macrosteles quadrilineatus]XP_054261744.1 uncharacterized protein LOC128985834 [Macrosteles quadrilineatus]XP_054261754.1 uncharacterized protein LOC128985834 [Macrosteles quadrilineatus]XP_054261762.1 uncharacterized protein LOC128985834 [Macrosteles quadrilineatus]XP_054261771.1 uncharacterized protein LOC128985834 [Macrosteles quadrilineatus]